MIISITIAQNRNDNFIRNREERASTTYPRSAADVFWLHMRKRERENARVLSRFFFLSFLFLSFPPSIPSVDLSKGLVRTGRIFFSFL